MDLDSNFLSLMTDIVVECSERSDKNHPIVYSAHTFTLDPKTNAPNIFLRLSCISYKVQSKHEAKFCSK